jgi:hypothetical protein
MSTRARYVLVGIVLLSLFGIAIIAIGTPIWPEILACAAAGVVWFRYRWKTGIRAETVAAVKRHTLNFLSESARRNPIRTTANCSQALRVEDSARGAPPDHP